MIPKLITDNVWAALTSAVKSSKRKSFVAVAYFGKGGAEMLPLQKGSVLLVDASEGAVSAGQTCPQELLKLLANGVEIYSLKNLHAKLYVVGGTLFVGSANVSSNSEENLVEVLIKTSERKVVEAAKEFILSNCIGQVGLERLEYLDSLYPKDKKGFGGKSKATIRLEDSVSYFIYETQSHEFDDEEQRLVSMCWKSVGRHRIKSSGYAIDEISWHGKLPKVGDIIFQVENIGSTSVLYPGSTVTEICKEGGKAVLLAERPLTGEKKFRDINKHLESKERNKLLKQGPITISLAAKLAMLLR